MKITIVSETYFPDINGVAMTLNHLVTGLSKLGHQVQVVCPHNSDRDPKLLPASISFRFVNSLPIPGYCEAKLGLPSKRFLNKLWTTERPDVLYVATEGPLGWYAIKEANDKNIPVVSGFHTNFHTYSEHYRIGFLKNIVERYLVNLHNKTSCTLTPTIGQKDVLQTMGITNISVLDRGVDSNLFSPNKRSKSLRDKWGVSSEETVMLYVGRIAAEKNLSLALQTYKSLSKSNKGLKFVIVGDGPLYNNLKKENPNFIFAGTLKGEELAVHYASSDIFVFPSLTETFGNVILEAMASGLGVVAFDYAAAHQHIQTNHNGLLASLNNPQEFINNAHRYLESHLLLQKLRQHAYNYSKQQTWPKIVSRFEQILLSQITDNTSRWILAN